MFYERDIFEIGEDLTEYLNVVKWDPPPPTQLHGRAKGNFPIFIPKTDQERIQNVSARVLNQFRNDEFEVTIKLDGSSMTVYHNDGHVGVCSRNLELDWENDTSTFTQVFKDMNLAQILPHFGNIALQGELMGPGVQGNRECLPWAEFFLFDIYDIDNRRYLSMGERYNLHQAITDMQWSAEKLMRHVTPLRVEGIRDVDITEKKRVLQLAEGSSLCNKVREGIVFKSVDHPEFSFKAISNAYLLEKGE